MGTTRIDLHTETQADQGAIDLAVKDSKNQTMPFVVSPVQGMTYPLSHPTVTTKAKGKISLQTYLSNIFSLGINDRTIEVSDKVMSNAKIRTLTPIMENEFKMDLLNSKKHNPYRDVIKFRVTLKYTDTNNPNHFEEVGDYMWEEIKIDTPTRASNLEFKPTAAMTKTEFAESKKAGEANKVRYDQLTKGCGYVTLICDASFQAPTVSLTIKIQDDRIFKIDDTSINTFIEDLKECIHTNTGIEKHLQRLLLQNTVLNDNKTLGDYGITADTTLHVVKKTRGNEADPADPQKYVELEATATHEHYHQSRVKRGPGKFVIKNIALYRIQPIRSNASTDVFEILTQARERARDTSLHSQVELFLPHFPNMFGDNHNRILADTVAPLVIQFLENLVIKRNPTEETIVAQVADEQVEEMRKQQAPEKKASPADQGLFSRQGAAAVVNRPKFFDGDQKELDKLKNTRAIFTFSNGDRYYLDIDLNNPKSDLHRLVYENHFDNGGKNCINELTIDKNVRCTIYPENNGTAIQGLKLSCFFLNKTQWPVVHNPKTKILMDALKAAFTRAIQPEYHPRCLRRLRAQ